MQINFKSRAANGSEMRKLLVERELLASRQLTAMVPYDKVRTSNENGMLAGMDKLRQLALSTEPAGRITLASLMQEWRSALSRFFRRAVCVWIVNIRRIQQHVLGRTAKKSVER